MRKRIDEKDIKNYERLIARAAIGETADSLSEVTKKRVAQMYLVHDEAIKLFAKKNSDYGDAFAEQGTVGVLVRIMDKLKRFQKITGDSITLVDTESLRDTLLDLHNYSAMAIMLMDEMQRENEQDSGQEEAVRVQRAR